MYSSKTFDTPCPKCKAAHSVTWSAWDDDCRGNPGGYGIGCAKCDATFTHEQWRRIASAELAQMHRAERQREREWQEREQERSAKS
jgi:RecJ-like exonuclease